MGIRGDAPASPDRPVRAVRIPTEMVSFLNRVMALPAGLHLIYVIKTEGGGAGIIGWSVEENKLERPASKTD